MEIKEKEYLESIAKEIRKLTTYEIVTLGEAGHIGGTLSIADTLAVLYFKAMNIDPKNPKMEGRDRFVMSKGHAGPAVYATLALKGYFDKKELDTLNRPNTNLPSHCDMNKTIGIDMTAGSLGQGISCAVGMAIASKLKGDNAKIYAVVGDGECNEGQVWEAMLSAAHFKLDNLIVFCDNNKIQLDGYTKDIMDLGDLHAKFESFGFNTLSINGHDVEAISDAIDNGKKNVGSPTMIVLDTVKGKGLSFIEEIAPKNHSVKITKEQLEIAYKELA